MLYWIGCTCLSEGRLGSWHHRNILNQGMKYDLFSPSWLSLDGTISVTLNPLVYACQNKVKMKWCFLSQQVILVQVNPGEAFTIQREDGQFQCITGKKTFLFFWRNSGFKCMLSQKTQCINYEVYLNLCSLILQCSCWGKCSNSCL